MNEEHSHMACGAISHEAASCFQAIADHQSLPSVLYRPKLYIDGNQWCALYGENLQDGIAGFGDTPAKAVMNFNKAWYEPLCNSSSGLVKYGQGESNGD